MTDIYYPLSTAIEPDPYEKQPPSVTKLTIILFLFFAIHFHGVAQRKASWQRFTASPRSHTVADDSVRVDWVDTLPITSMKGFSRHANCKAYAVSVPKLAVIGFPGLKVQKKSDQSVERKDSRRLLKVSGNVLYDVSYRSNIDTPYAEKDVLQHMLQTRLDFVYKEQYPFKVYVNTRFSNSQLFKRYTDVNLRYNRQDFQKLLKKRILDSIESFVSRRRPNIDSLETVMLQRKAKIAALNHMIQKPNLAQQRVQRREKEIFQQSNESSVPAISTELPDVKWLEPRQYKFNRKNNFHFSPAQDSVDSGFPSDTTSLADIKSDLDSLRRSLRQTELMYAALNNQLKFDRLNWKKQIEDTDNADSLRLKLKRMNMPDSLLPKGYKTLYGIRSVSVGRSVADYSELSVRNVSISGIQVEYNPNYYYAFAVGKLDYRFRDYIVPNRLRSNQYVALARFGKGERNGNHLIFTYYTGKRQFFNAAVSTQQPGSIPEYRLAGMTIEGYYQLSRNIMLTAEAAKSTKPYYSLDSLQKENWINSVAHFNDRGNEAYALALHAYIPRTFTRLNGKIGYIGADFQSFSTFTTGAARTQWAGRIEQPFWKKQITVTSSIQQNVYNNPFVTTSYKSSSILASVRGTLRKKKWPTVSVGFFPSYQLTKISEDDYSETRYYTLMANTSYIYRFGSADFTSYFVFSQFYNHAADSGFIYFNCKNYLLGHSATVNRLTMLLNASVSTNVDYNLYTLEHSDQFSINHAISLGAGVKMIRQTTVDRMLWGYSGNIQLSTAKLGDVQLTVDSGFIPSLDRQLSPNKTGRLTYLKSF